MHRNSKYILRVAIIVIFFVLIAGYSAYQARKIIRGPEISIYSPTDGATVNDALVEIKGKASNIKDISLDDKPIFIDEQGNFNEKLLMPSGYTIISMKASDRFGNKTEKSISIYYGAPVATSTPIVASSSSSL